MQAAAEALAREPSKSERRSWERSLPALARVIGDSAFDPVQINISDIQVHPSALEGFRMSKGFELLASLVIKIYKLLRSVR